MRNSENNQQQKGKEPQQEKAGVPELGLDDLDNEIIELVDIINGEVTDSDEALLIQRESADKQEYVEDFLLDDLSLEEELDDDDLLLYSVIESMDDKEQAVTDDLGMDSGIGEEISLEQVASSDIAAERVSGVAPEGFEEADDLLVDLFTSNEVDIGQLLAEAEERKAEVREAERKEEIAAAEEPPEDLFAQLDVEIENLVDKTVVSAEAVLDEGALPGDQLPEFESEAEAVIDESDIMAADGSLVTDELPEDLLSEFEFSAEAFADESDITAAEAVLDEGALPEDLLSEFETGAEAATDERFTEGAEPEGATLSPGVVEELAELVSAQVKEVVTRVMEERLPSMVERIIAQEINKAKTSKE